MSRNKPYIIAEAGVNHNGSLKVALEMISVAKESGADAIKFQTAIPEAVSTPWAGKASYQLKNTGVNESQLEMIKKIHLPLTDYARLKNECEALKIDFLSSPFDEESISFLDDIGLKTFKIPSGEITNFPFLVKIARTNKPIILSTGMANLEEIKLAIELLVDSGADLNKITILHCNTEYPTAKEDVNLRAMTTIKETFKVDVGYSDHTLGNEVSCAAVAMGAVMIEKHFTLDKKMKGPDHAASLNPKELKHFVSSLREIEKILGSPVKSPNAMEKRNIPIVRKSIVAKKDILIGEIFNTNNITTKRPGTGVSPFKWNDILGKPSLKSYSKNDLIDE